MDLRIGFYAKKRPQDLILRSGIEHLAPETSNTLKTYNKKLLSKKSEWYSLPFQAQSDYKCHYVGLESERFNDVIWE